MGPAAPGRAARGRAAALTNRALLVDQTCGGERPVVGLRGLPRPGPALPRDDQYLRNAGRAVSGKPMITDSDVADVLRLERELQTAE